MLTLWPGRGGTVQRCEQRCPPARVQSLWGLRNHSLAPPRGPSHGPLPPSPSLCLMPTSRSPPHHQHSYLPLIAAARRPT